MQPTGVLTATISRFGNYIVLDYHYVEIDSFACQGYETDSHDLLLLSNGHALLIGNDYRTVDMSDSVAGGNENANVQGQIIQELDEYKNVIKEWNCWDYYDITGAIHEDITGATIDFTHLNSIAFDYDSNLVISLRNLSEITKINWNTGEIIWRFGGKNNWFQITGDQYEVSYQHDVRPVPGKPNHYTMFDNGNHCEPYFSRAVEYKIDPVNRTAEKVWEFDLNQERFTQMMGSVQNLPNGNRFIDWCEWPPLYACEVDTNNQIVYELTVHGISSYRSRRFEWEGMLQTPYLIAESYYTGITLIFNKFADPDVDHYNIYGGTQPNPTTLLTTTQETYAVLTELENDTDWFFRVTAVDQYGIESDYSNEEQVYTFFIDPRENIVLNGDFSEGTDHWVLIGGQTTGEIDNEGQYHLHIEYGGTLNYHVQLYQENLKLLNGNRYLFEFNAYADSERTINGIIIRSTTRWENYGKIGFQYLTTQKKHFEYEFQMQYPTDLSASVVFNCGGQSNTDIYLDNISLKEIPSSSIENKGSKPAEFILYQNYPNPFNYITEFVFHIPLSLIHI